MILTLTTFFLISSQSTAVPEIDKEASIAGRTSEKFVSYTTENKQIVTLEKPSTSTVEQGKKNYSSFLVSISKDRL